MNYVTPPSVLVVEDESDLRQLVGDSLQAAGFEPVLVATAAEAMSRLDAFAFDALVVDLRLPDADGMDVLTAATERYPGILGVVVTGFGGVDEAVTAIKHGAIDFLIKPFQLGRLSRVLSAGLDQQRLRAENAELRAQLQDRYRFDSIVGQSTAMRQVFSTLELVAPMNSTVLIHGETGTGKELIARTIHHNSPRADQRFVAFNAAAIPETLAEAELFGHTKGAFTGAVNSRVGRFEMAHRGTLFIDEVGLMPLSLQSKLLRTLQEREIERIGESRPIKFDARIIAASNTRPPQDGEGRDLPRGSLLPAERDSRSRCRRCASGAKTCRCWHGTSSRSPAEATTCHAKTLSQDAVRALMNFTWPGNIRQLENAVEHAVAMSGAEAVIGAATLPEDVLAPGHSTIVPTVSIPDEGINFTSVVSQLERELILRVLEKTRGNKRQAARLLNLSRTTFIDKLQRLHLADDAAAAS